MHYKIFFFALGILCLGDYTAQAADSEFGRNSPQAAARAMAYKVTQNYDETLGRIYQSGKAEKYEIFNLRSYYPMTEQYVPFADEILDKMMQLSFTVQNSKDPAATKKAVKEYRGLVSNHFASLEVLFLAATLAEQDVRLGDPVFFKDASEALYDVIIDSNDGLSLRHAIKVVTFGEEDIILRRYGQGKLVKSELFESGLMYINIHQMKDSKTGKITKLFFNISDPIHNVSKKEEEKVKLNRF